MPKTAPTYSPIQGVKKFSRSGAKERQRRRALATNSAKWRRLRAQVLADQPLCAECLPMLEPSTQVDHINGNANDNRRENLQSLCARHHSQKTVREDGGFGRKRAQ